MRRRSYRKSARVMWWGFVAWSVLVIVSVLVTLGFVYVFTVAFS
jgi:hypothetical protein